MKKVLSLLLVVLILICNVSLVSCDYEISIQKKTTAETTREAKYEDIYCDIKIDESGVTILKIYAIEKIEDLVLQINLETEDGSIIKTFTLNVGRVVPGDPYTYRLDVSDISLKDLKAVTKMTRRIVDGYVIIQ